MFPLRDDNPTEIFPVITVALIAACVACWVWVQGAGFDFGRLADSVCAYGAIPAEISGRVPEPMLPMPGDLDCRLGGRTWSALLTSMFLHGSWMHLLGNMWFLWIFGNNVEDSMGHLRFLLFYVVTGMVALGAHIFSDPGSIVPTVGASGAISAIMGAYVVLYPRARVMTLLVIVIFIRIVPLPAWIMLGYWLLIQLLSASVPSAGGGGVAFWAHIGGFLAGVTLIGLFKSSRLVDAKRAKIKLPRDQMSHGGWF